MTQDQAILARPGAGTRHHRQVLHTPDKRAVVLAGLLVVGWCLTGVTLVPLDGRAVYELFGTPVAVMGPGLHAGLPWPFGHVRRLDFGAVHEVALAGPTGVRLLYRVGVTDAQALDAAYGSADPDLLMQDLGSEASAADRGADAGTLQAAIQAELDREDSGLEILGVLGAPHGADRADSVRAATIAAQAILAEARSKAAIERARARQVSAERVAAARAKAAETVASARSLLVAFGADQAADKASSKSFLLERYFANLTRAIGTSPKTIIDHRLNWPAAPELDLRPPPGISSVDGKAN
jgi:hypothetical protein